MTPRQQTQVEAIVHHLAEALKENEQFYRTAANNAINDRLQELLQERAAQRAKFAASLLTYEDVALRDVEPNEVKSDHVMDAVHRGMVTIKAAMTIEPDKTDEVVMRDSAAAEQKLLSAYESTLAEPDLPPALNRLLHQQYTQIQATYSYAGAVAQGGYPVVVGLFIEAHDIQQAIHQLQARGISRDEIDVVAEEAAATEMFRGTGKDMAKEGAGAAALGGGVLGGVLGLVLGTAITVAFGPVLILGVPALAGTVAAGTAIGASHGALFVASLGWGLAEENVDTYIKGVRQGQILLIVRVPVARSEEVTAILQETGGQFVTTRAEPIATLST